MHECISEQVATFEGLHQCIMSHKSEQLRRAGYRGAYDVVKPFLY